MQRVSIRDVVGALGLENGMTPCELPSISVIVAVRESSVEPACLSSIARSKFPCEKLEILTAAGDNPSAQRNRAIDRATGDILYFVDDDSVIAPRTLLNLVHAFEDYPDIAGVGGPSVGIYDGTPFQKCAAMAMGSVFGFGPLRHRYYPSGCPRLSSEHELILSNLAVKRSVLEQAGRFNTRLYPSEEAELIRRLELRGHRFLYHPGVVVSRPARENLFELALQVYRYGSSRAKHLKIRAHQPNVLIFLPSLFCLYLTLAAVFGLRHPVALSSLNPLLAVVLLGPLAAYCALTAAASAYAGLSVGRRKTRTFLSLLAIYPTIHVGYGIGMIRGFFSSTVHELSARTIELSQWKQLDEGANMLWRRSSAASE
ncbi:MAG: glycosyltransferase [Bdellovibrionota bacterium]